MWNDICFCTRSDCPRTDCRRHWNHHPKGEPFSYYEGEMCSNGEFNNCNHYWWGANTQYGGERLNLNTATEEELFTLDGMGKVKVAGILAYRESHGGFSDVSELLKCHGIHKNSYEKIKHKVCV